jgi:hypothetical protein
MFDDETPEEKLLSSIRGAKGAPRARGFARVKTACATACGRFFAACDKIAIGIAVIVLVGACGTIVRTLRLAAKPPIAPVVAAPQRAAHERTLEVYQKGIREHDLFGVAPAAASGQQVHADFAGLLLQGVITAEPRQAILKDAKNDTTLFVAEGDALGGYTVAKIEDGKVTLKNGDDRFEIKM